MFRLSMWMTVAAVLAMALCPVAFAAGSGAKADEGSGTKAGIGASGAGKTVLLDDFEGYAETETWDGAGKWQIKIGEGVNAKIAIGKAYGKPLEDGTQSKGMLYQNTKVDREGRLLWVNASRQLPEVKDVPVFTIRFDYYVPKPPPAGSGRIDFGLSETGGAGGYMFISITKGMTFIYKDDVVNKKTLYEHADAKEGEWHTVSVEVDQNQDKFRVSLDGEIVKGDWGEWANFRYDKTLSPEKPKSISINTAHTWPDSTHYIDNISILIPGADAAK